MLTHYRLEKKIKIKELFDGRLERFGVYNACTKDVTRTWGCLHDDRNSLIVHGDELVESMTGFGLFNATEKILTAITTAFNTEIFSEYNPQVWMYKTEEEWHRDRRKSTERNPVIFYNMVIEHARGETQECTLLRDGLLMVRVAKDLIIENPDLASPEREMELMEKTNKRSIAMFNTIILKTMQKSMVATPEGELLH
jgi:UDP-2,3-diacylglucosamine pyrophosphatase LpxH